MMEEEEEEIPDEIIAEEEEEEEAVLGEEEGGGERVWREKWLRPEIAAAAAASSSPEVVLFQWISIDVTTGEKMRGAPGAAGGPVPIVRLYGVTKEGHSVCARCFGFTPYCYASLSDPKLAPKIEAELNASLSRKTSQSCATTTTKAAVLGTEIVTGKSLMGYRESEETYLKIYVSLPSMIPTLRNILVDGVRIGGGGNYVSLQPFESNVPFVLRFLIDNEMSGCSWVEVSKFQRSEGTTRCQVTIDCIYSDLKPDNSKVDIAPLRVLATDIECQGRKGHFPQAEKDPVIQISCVLTVRETVIAQIVFTLGECAPISGADVIPAKTEQELLLNWSGFVKRADPDIITGYNTQNFDIPYLLKRAAALKLRNFSDFGRVFGAARMRPTTNKRSIETTVSGRVMFDLLPHVIRDHKLSSYSLNSVCAEFLNQQKEDVHHSIISELQNGTNEDRRRLAVYCLKDSQLVIRLISKLSVLINYVEMARVTGVPLDFLITRGQQIKVFSMLLRRCRTHKFYVPQTPPPPPSSKVDSSYAGATVVEPKRGFYDKEPVATLDFASLYPSIMQAYNLCYSTLLAPSSQAATTTSTRNDCRKAPDGTMFTTKAKGLLPEILEDLLAARKQAKKDMKSATDPFTKAVQNGRQLALKISANSVYGFAGAAAGQLPCLAVASAVTAYGRDLLLKTKAYVEEHYPKATVIYGDTDSVMVTFGAAAASIADAMPLAERIAKEVTEIFPNPVKLEFEKVYFPYLLMNKKRYAGLLWTTPEKYDYLDAKGLETVRRDNCLLVRQLVDACLRLMIIRGDVDAALAHAKSVISDLLQNKIDVSLLVITKSLSTVENYKAKQAHAELAKKMKARDPGTAPSAGDRVPYVIVPGPKGAAAYEKAEDPAYVLENNLPVDARYYLENQLYKPLRRIFEPVVKDTEFLLKGDHTRVVCKPTPVARKGGIVAFASRKLQCLGCKVIISSGVVCDHCKPREQTIFLKRLKHASDHEKVFNNLWTQCQRCQGSLHQDVLCTNSDCPIFYKRKKVQADLKEAQTTLARFDW
ncbi:hypothetical protein CTAYLR_002097 [Chrysophaeum taylorii]|uniref:DNA polymerase n=1 Tax=Chrysophaeum taylorii TaxID=2483200 RepID=A0AAD7UME7_9STRA|nr:hypothetical protein CTAYLR_002097 [Chrysophaeum taylorii]